jgi:hypothetical protein
MAVRAGQPGRVGAEPGCVPGDRRYLPTAVRQDVHDGHGQRRTEDAGLGRDGGQRVDAYLGRWWPILAQPQHDALGGQHAETGPW